MVATIIVICAILLVAFAVYNTIRNRAVVRAKQEMTESDFTEALQDTSYLITTFGIKGGEKE